MTRSVRTVGLLVLLLAVLTAAAPGVLRYRISRGDTLSALAAKQHTTVARIRQLNHLTGSTIYAGDFLLLPGRAPSAAPSPTPAATTTRAYTVKPGDNLTVLARRMGTTVAELRARNHLRSSVIVIGQHLTYLARTPAAAPASAAAGAGPAARSAASHRASLARRSLPNKATVRAMIRSAAGRHGVPASLALALAYQESGFQQRVVSPVDAIGVMQVLPRTGRSLGRLHGRSFDLLKTSDNIEAGVLLIRDLLRSTGSPQGMLAAYYQGLGSIDRVGLLPQTKQYVRNISLLQRRFA